MAFPQTIETLNAAKANATDALTDHPNHHNDLARIVNAIQAILAGLRVVNVMNPAYGALFDGVNDDGPAIQAAIDAVAAEVVATDAVGGIVLCPKGVGLTNQQLVLKNRVTVRGMGKYATRIVAGGAFPINTALVRLGDGASIVFNCRLEDLYLECSGISGSKGAYSTEANERSGVFRCGISNFMDRGVHIVGTGGTAQNFQLREVDALADPGSTGAVGIHVEQCSGLNSIVGASVGASSPATLAAGVRSTLGSTLMTSEMHFERATAGVKYEGGSVGVIFGVQGHSTVTNTVELDACPNVLVLGPIDKNGGTNSLLVDGVAVTASIMHQAFGTGGILRWGADVTLYRGAADILKTDDSLEVVGTLGIGTAPIASQFLRIIKEVAGSNLKAMAFLPSFRPDAAGTFANGIDQTPKLVGTEGVTTPTTTEMNTYMSRPTVDATYDAAIAAIAGYYALQVAHAGGGAITNQYGFYTNISAGATNNWQFYGAGTGKSHLGGDLNVVGQLTTPAAHKVVTADITKSDTALADVTGLTFAVEANATYTFDFWILHLAAAATTGMSFALNGPASPTYLLFNAIIPTSATVHNQFTQGAYETKVTTTDQLTTVLASMISGTLVNGANAGTFALRWSPEVAVSATIKRGSWGRVVKVG